MIKIKYVNTKNEVNTSKIVKSDRHIIKKDKHYLDDDLIFTVMNRHDEKDNCIVVTTNIKLSFPFECLITECTDNNHIQYGKENVCLEIITEDFRQRRIRNNWFEDTESALNFFIDFFVQEYDLKEITNDNKQKSIELSYV